MAQYKGFEFPFKTAPTEAPASAVPPELLIASIKQILLTERGERVMRPTFGSNLRRKIFENINKGLVTDIQKEIVAAITKWEPRVKVEKIDVVQDAVNTSLVAVTVQFTALGQLSSTGPVLIGG